MKHLKAVLSVLLLFLASCHAVTSLQRAFERAFNERVADGTFTELIYSAGVDGTDACPGNYLAWDWPERVEGSDLDRVLDRGTLICGINRGNVARSATGVVLVQDDGSGAVNEFWKEITATVGEHYGVELSVTWENFFENSPDVLRGVLDGTFDGACGRWAMGGTIDGKARSATLSPLSCLTYTTVINVWIPNSLTGINSFADLITAIESGQSICSPNSDGGGTQQSCVNSINQFTQTRCDGLGEMAWTEALSDDDKCSFVWSGSPPAELTGQFRTVETPFHEAKVSYWRHDDLNSIAEPSQCGLKSSAAGSLVPYAYSGLIGVALFIAQAA